MCTTLYRSKNFRHEFCRLREVQGVIPEHIHVNVMALTATAAMSSRTEIICSLDMQKPVIVSVLRQHFLLCIREVIISASLGPLCDRLASRRTAMGRTIIFCHKYDEVTTIYYFFRD